MVDKVREVALKIIYKINEKNAYSNIALNETIKQSKEKMKLNEKDIRFISEIVYGVTTWKLTLDEIIKKHSKIKMKKISPWIINILRMSIYQIIFLDKVPKSAAVNEGVNLAKKYGHYGSSGFVNAILRKVEKEDYEELSNIEDIEERISKMMSIPKWIIEELKSENISIKQIEQICKNSNIRPKITARINKLKTSKEELKTVLEQKGIIVSEGILKDFFVLEKVKNIEDLEEFQKGFFTVQDEAAGLTALILNPEQGQVILDACSSPGGKTTYMAEIMKNNGEIQAWDLHENRVELVKKNTQRLNIDIVETNVSDATIYNKKYIEKFDKILLDVPCMGLGVLKRKPDVKWQRTRNDIDIISEIQYKILDNCSKYLKPNGELVYSTCSILNIENEGLILKFLKQNENFTLEKITQDIMENETEKYFEKYLIDEKFLQVYQNEKTDGFFICKLAKKGKN